MKGASSLLDLLYSKFRKFDCKLCWWLARVVAYIEAAQMKHHFNKHRPLKPKEGEKALKRAKKLLKRFERDKK